jgi:hypothetical protein
LSSGASNCAEAFSVPHEILTFWETRYVRVLADALHYPLEADPKRLKPILREMYGVAVRQAVEQLRAHGHGPLQSNLGDLLLAREAHATAANPEETAFRTVMAQKRQDGVRDPDFRDWWNNYLFAAALEMMLHQAELDFTLLRLAGSEKLGLEQAKVQLMKTVPVYGDPADSSWATGEDRRLYIELYHRVARYLRGRTQADPGALERDLQQFSSFNALIRHEMRTGRLYEGEG